MWLARPTTSRATWNYVIREIFWKKNIITAILMFDPMQKCVLLYLQQTQTYLQRNRQTDGQTDGRTETYREGGRQRGKQRDRTKRQNQLLQRQRQGDRITDRPIDRDKQTIERILSSIAVETPLVHYASTSPPAIFKWVAVSETSPWMLWVKPTGNKTKNKTQQSVNHFPYVWACVIYQAMSMISCNGYFSACSSMNTVHEIDIQLPFCIWIIFEILASKTYTLMHCYLPCAVM